MQGLVYFLKKAFHKTLFNRKEGDGFIYLSDTGSRIRTACFFCLCIIGNSSAQNPVFKNYSVSSGLPSQETYDIISDSKGFLWIATDGGICRFDGYAFKLFSVKNGLPESTIFKLHEDRKGRIWFSSINSRVGYILNDSVFVLDASFKKPTEIANSSFISSFYVDQDDTLWMGTFHSGLLYKIGPPYIHVKPLTITIKKNYFLQFDHKSSVIFGTGPYNFDSTTNSVLLKASIKRSEINFDTLHIPIRKDEYNKTFVRYDDAVYFFGTGPSLYKMEKNGISLFKTFTHDISTLSVDQKGFLWVGELLEGVFCFKSPDENNRCDQYFKGLTITSVLSDFENGYWFSTLEKGVLYVPCLELKSLDFPNAFAQKQISSVQLLPSGGIAAQSYLGPLYIFRKDSVSEMNNTGISIFIAPGKQDELFYTGVLNSGYVHLPDYSNHVFREPKTGINYFLKKYESGNDKQLYAAGINNLYEVNSQSGTIQNILHLKERINSFVVDENNVFWIATTAGLCSYRKNESPHYFGKTLPELSINIDRIIEDHSGKLWLGTKGNGILVFDKKNKITVLTERSGLSSDFCSTLYCDSLNTIWTGTNNGLCKISAEGFKITTYDFLNEFIPDRINDINRSGNYLYAANLKGVFIFDINQLEKKNINAQFPLYIQHVSSKNNIAIAENSVLDYTEDHIHISFIGLSYSSSGNLRYAYKLEGLETEWHYTTNLSIDYYNLPAGQYRFILKAVSGNQNESRHPVVFSFTIAPPFWKTSWFILLILLAGISLAYLIFRYRIIQIRKEEKNKADIRIFTANMEARSLRAQMNPHFIFNALNSIQNFVLKNDKNSAQSYLSKFARLIRNILEFSQADFILLKNEIETIGLYLELEKLRAADKFRYSISIDDAISPDSVYIPAMLIQPIVENAILHGLLPMEKENGMLKISFRKKDQLISCTIEDNGIGRDKAKELNLAKQKQHRSMAASITKERLEVLKKIHSLDSTCTIEDLTDVTQKSCGTKVTLTFPFKNKPE